MATVPKIHARMAYFIADDEGAYDWYIS